MICRQCPDQYHACSPQHTRFKTKAKGKHVLTRKRKKGSKPSYLGDLLHNLHLPLLNRHINLHIQLITNLQSTLLHQQIKLMLGDKRLETLVREMKIVEPCVAVALRGKGGVLGDGEAEGEGGGGDAGVDAAGEGRNGAGSNDGDEAETAGGNVGGGGGRGGNVGGGGRGGNVGGGGGTHFETGSTG